MYAILHVAITLSHSITWILLRKFKKLRYLYWWVGVTTTDKTVFLRLPDTSFWKSSNQTPCELPRFLFQSSVPHLHKLNTKLYNFARSFILQRSFCSTGNLNLKKDYATIAKTSALIRDRCNCLVIVYVKYNRM